MVTFGYIFLWFLAQLLALGLGALTHYAHAFLSLPEKLFDGHRWQDHALNGALSSGYVWWADYDEQGFWEFESLKNFSIHAAPPSLIVLGFAVAWFPERAEKLSAFCGAIAKAGVKPVLCS